MKNFVLAVLSLALAAPTAFAQAPTTEAPKYVMPPPVVVDKTRNVAFLIYDGIEPLDLSGPLDVFVKANFVTGGGFNYYTVGLTHDMVQTQSQTFGIMPRFSIDDAPKPDVIIVPGATTDDSIKVGKNPRAQNWLRANSQADQTIMSVCTGAYVVGGAGLFDGRDATTHWLSLSKFAAMFPSARVYGGVRYINDGNIYSSGGITSGIDGALHLIEHFAGANAADRVASALTYRRDLPAFPSAVKTRIEPELAVQSHTHADEPSK